MKKDRSAPTRNFLDNLLRETSQNIGTQRKIGKSRISTSVSENTSDKFMEFVKRNHGDMVKGPYSFELERALLFYLHFFDTDRYNSN